MGITERKEREKQKRRKEILAAAEKIFFAKNGDTGTMDDVAEKVELSKGTLYLYFRNKTDLLYAIAEKGVGLLTKCFSTVLKPERTGREQLSDLGDEFVRFVEEYPRHFELIMRFEVTGPRSKEVRETNLLMKPALSVLRDVLIRGQQDGTIRNDLSEDEIVIILWSQMAGLMQSILRKERYIDHYRVNFKRVIKGHYRIIMKGIAPG
ncbi:MAG: TetR family transcriptional regulator [Bacteroidetes bacterium]|nr:TetR family transcriptional regulator [Bacteroidota bacterium]